MRRAGGRGRSKGVPSSGGGPGGGGARGSSSGGASGGAAGADGGRKRPRDFEDEELVSSESDSDGSDVGGRRRGGAGSDADDEVYVETADEKRIRLAKEYIRGITGKNVEDLGGDDVVDDGGYGAAAARDDREAIDNVGFVAKAAVAERLKEEVLASRGDLFRPVAASLKGYVFPERSTTKYRGHKLPVTCVALSSDDATAFSGAKDGTIIQWDVETGKRTRFPGGGKPCPEAKRAKRKVKQQEHQPRVGGGSMFRPQVSHGGHTDEVLCMAVSTDGRYLASGGRDNVVRVWDVRSATNVEAFVAHRSAVSGVAFRKESHQLFSSSFDRTINQWNLDEMTFVDSLFGHASEVHAIDCLYRERVVSCGRDRSVRLWKIPEDTHLVFRGQTSTVSLECVKCITDTWFACGAQDGSLALYTASKKKPAVSVAGAHPAPSVGEPWVNSLACLPTTDLLASGSCDGYVRLWEANTGQLTGERASLNPVAEIPMPGFVNALAFANSGRFLLSGIGYEHRLGRWWRLRDGVQNGIAITQLPADRLGDLTPPRAVSGAGGAKK